MRPQRTNEWTSSLPLIFRPTCLNKFWATRNFISWQILKGTSAMALKRNDSLIYIFTVYKNVNWKLIKVSKIVYRISAQYVFYNYLLWNLNRFFHNKYRLSPSSQALNAFSKIMKTRVLCLHKIIPICETYLVTNLQCDQMATLFFNILPFTSLKICQSWFKMLPNTK